MRITFLFFIVAVTFLSCAKSERVTGDHSCVCSNGDSYVIKDATQSEAVGWCDMIMSVRREYSV